MSCQYFDTVAPAISINILKTGFLFVAAEGANHALYLFKSDGDDEQSPVVCYSKNIPKERSGSAISAVVPEFYPRLPRNLEKRDELTNLGPINDMRVEDLINEGSN